MRKKDSNIYDFDLSSSNMHKLGEMSPEAEKTAKKSRKTKTNKFQKYIDDIWKRLESGQIDLCFAHIGFSSQTDYPVYDKSLMIEELVCYGYPILAAIEFIDDFCRNADALVTVDFARQAIYEKIKPIAEVGKMVAEDLKK